MFYDIMLFHVNLKYLCRTFGITQEGLAVHMKKTQTTIGNWQSGKSEPSLEELIVLSIYFSIDLSTLITIDIEKNKLITPELIADFRAKSSRRVTPREQFIKGNTPGNYDYRLAESQVSEEDKTTNWVVLNELRNLSEKVDQVRLSLEKMTKNKR